MTQIQLALLLIIQNKSPLACPCNYNGDFEARNGSHMPVGVCIEGPERRSPGTREERLKNPKRAYFQQKAQAKRKGGKGQGGEGNGGEGKGRGYGGAAWEDQGGKGTGNRGTAWGDQAGKGTGNRGKGWEDQGGKGKGCGGYANWKW